MEFNFAENDINQNFLFDEKEFNDIFQYEDRIIFLIDYDAIIFKNDNLEESNNQIFIRLFKKFLRNKMMNNGSCKIALIFYNCEFSCNDFDFPFIYIFYNLDNIQADWIKDTENLERFLIKSSNTQNYYADLAQVYNVCEQQFNKCKNEVKNYYQRIFLFTIQDEPYFDNQIQKNNFLQQINNIQNNSIEIDLFPLQFGEPYFDVQKFYGTILKIDLDEVNSEFLEPIKKLEQLDLKLKKKEIKKRPVYKSKLQLGNNTQIGMKVYSIYKKLKKQSSVILNNKNYQILKKAKVPKLDKTEQKISEDLIEKRLIMNDEQILLTDEDINDIKNFIEEKFSIIGFKPKSCIKSYMNVGPTFFLVPDDSQVEGSSQSLDALIKEMIKKDKVGIMKIKPINSYLKFAFLVPQAQKIIKNQFQPSGLHVIISPYADDIRDLSQIEPINTEDLTEQDVQIASNLIETLTIQNFDPSNFENPTLQHFYNKLHQMALNNENPTQIVDTMLPDYEGIQIQQNVIEQFNKHFFQDLNEDSNYIEEQSVEKKQEQEFSYQNTEIKSQGSQDKIETEIQDIIKKIQQDEKVLVRELNKVLNYIVLRLC